MPDLSWREAIIQVLQGHPEPMHYGAIAEEIAERELRTELRGDAGGDRQRDNHHLDEQ